MFLTEVVEVMVSTLIHFMPFVSFYTPWKHQKTFGFPNAFNGYRKDSGMKCFKMKLSLMFFFFSGKIFLSHSHEGVSYQRTSYNKSNFYFTSKLHMEVQDIFRGFWSFRFLKKFLKPKFLFFLKIHKKGFSKVFDSWTKPRFGTSWTKYPKNGLSKFFKGCLPQNLFRPLLNTLPHLSVRMWRFSSLRMNPAFVIFKETYYWLHLK